MDVVPAEPSDLLPILAMRDRAASWQQRRGITQWLPGEVTVPDLRRQAERGELFVIRSEGVPIASVRLVWRDRLVWGDQGMDDRAGYVHGLVTVRRGSGLGAELLIWAEAAIADSGRNLVRLDCAVSNARLRRYYLQRGYGEVGATWFDDARLTPTMRFEKALRPV